MGNSLGGRRQVVVDEKYTRPQGLYEHKDIDHNRLRKLILDAKLAPCYPGDGDCTTHDLEECPICLLYYPSLNRSTCCTKGICTECFLQMKPLHSTRPTQCPFCNASNYAVQYRGVRSEEEKAMEQIEEQRVIEAKIRMQQQELLDEKERMQVRLDCSSSNQTMTPGGVGYMDIPSNSLAVPSYSLPDEGNEICSYHAPCPATSVSPSIPFRSNGSPSTVTRATSTPSSSVQRTTSTATVKPGLRKPVFIKVNQLKPGTNGHTLAVKVVTSMMILQKGHVASSHLRQSRIAECLVGDETGTVVFTARNEQVDMMKPGATVNLRNAKIGMFKGFMRLAIDKWGRIEVIEPANFIVKEDNNLSLVQYELVSVV